MVQCCAYDCLYEGVHRFPRKRSYRSQWVSALKRKNFKVTDSSRLCSRHFKESDFINEGLKTGIQSKRKVLKPKAVPSVFIWSTTSSPPPDNRSIRREQRETRKSETISKVERQLFVESEDPREFPQVEDTEDICAEDDNFSPVEVLMLTTEQCAEVVLGSSYGCEGQSTDEACCDDIECEEETEDRESDKKSCQSTGLLTLEKCMSDSALIMFYTGLESYEKFMFVYHTLCPEAEKVCYRWGGGGINISPTNALFLTLMKLKRDKTNFELAHFFGITERSVSCVFVTWINLMDQLWSQLDTWPSREIVNFYMPEGFKKSYPSTRVIVDATEFPITKPKQPAAQQATFSTYKNRPTMKELVGIAPNGLLSYKSEAYGGATSDRQIVERGDLVSKCEAGDSVMADRGFTVQDLFAHRGVTVNMPHFLKGQSQLPSETLLKDRALSSKRVHIERIIGLIKTYKILTFPLVSYFQPLASKIFSVCFMLCNFKEGIISKSA